MGGLCEGGNELAGSLKWSSALAEMGKVQGVQRNMLRRAEGIARQLTRQQPRTLASAMLYPRIRDPNPRVHCADDRWYTTCQWSPAARSRGATAPPFVMPHRDSSHYARGSTRLGRVIVLQMPQTSKLSRSRRRIEHFSPTTVRLLLCTVD
ncbi:hypothetical protein ANN_03359 [Periplaneta americana]|uniref:Uncharacterized protein n=1 Tax=Periplaneta americana TaxID=6978 RepID=A0ABQ8U0I6_PERAM|nr:hypothetical protein ANN_03359 [Periplaneta americana]